MSKGAHHFAKFDGWVPVFTAGTHTDSKQQTKVWTEADLDQIISNFDAADSAPIVVGHPKHDSPAFGWIDSLKREGAHLFAKFRDVAPKFVEWGKAGHIRNRSVKILSGAKGYRIGHVGFLGAMPPAVEGMDPIEFADDGGEIYEFGMSQQLIGSWSLRSLARGMRTLREWLVAEKGIESADKAFPVWPIEDMERAAAEAEAQNTPSSYTAPANQEATVPDPVKTYSQADLDNAVAVERAKTEKANQFAASLTAHRTFVSTLVSNEKGEVRLTPAQAEGVAEFLAALDASESAEFTFTAADKSEQKPKLVDFAKKLLGALPVQLKVGGERAGNGSAPADAAAHSFSAPAGTVVNTDQAELFARAKAYHAANPNLTWLAAVAAVGG